MNQGYRNFKVKIVLILAIKTLCVYLIKMDNQEITLRTKGIQI